MIELLKAFPNNVLAIKAAGNITSDDYQNVVIPELFKKSQSNNRVRVICFMKPELPGNSHNELWKDFYNAFSLTENLERLAIVTENRFIRIAMEVIGPRLSLSHRVYHEKDQYDAENWVLQ